MTINVVLIAVVAVVVIVMDVIGVVVVVVRTVVIIGINYKRATQCSITVSANCINRMSRKRCTEE